MVRIVDYRVRQSRDGEPFIALIVQSGLTMVRSQETGLYYATAKKASVPSTFDEETCKSLVGQEIEGTVEKVGCEPYQFASEETGEVLTLDYRWVYLKPGDTVEQAAKVQVHEKELELV